jgi:hypothetical protein
MSYDKISSPEPHLMNIFITERWIDEEKNVWYRVENVYPAYFTYQDLWKLDSSENTLEAMLFGFEYPDDLNTTDGNYRIWHRAQEAL